MKTVQRDQSSVFSFSARTKLETAQALNEVRKSGPVSIIIIFFGHVPRCRRVDGPTKIMKCSRVGPWAE